jgi:hypothetical protein
MKYIITFLFLLVITGRVNAENVKSEEKVLPRSGSLSQTISGVHGSRAVSEPWGGTDTQGKDQPPISGSVSRISPTRWVMRIFNNSSDAYSVDLSVVQLNRQGNKIKSDSFSYSLKPGQTAERDIAASSLTEQCSLDLRSWKKLGGKPSGTPTAAVTIKK